MAEADFPALMQRVRDGSPTAIQELLERYEPSVLRIIRETLPDKLRAQFDSVDFTQDVWKSFFPRLPQAATFETGAELAAYLAKIARNKVAGVVKRGLILQKHNANRERSLDDSKRFDQNQLIAPQQSPSEAVMTKENWQEFLKKQPLLYRRVFIEVRRGKSASEIAGELDLHVKTVRGLIRKLKSEFAS
jgi:RNA polymerase sigma factor (sigma-70 family)